MTKDKDFAEQVLFTLLNRECRNWSRAFLYQLILELTRKWAALASTEVIRAMSIELTESQI